MLCPRALLFCSGLPGPCDARSCADRLADLVSGFQSTHRAPKTYAILQGPEQVLVGGLDHLQACSCLHVFDPAVGLDLCKQ